MKKAAIELSLNFLVVIVISLVIFSFGVGFIYNIMSNSEDLKRMTIDDIDDRISALMCPSSEKVCVEKDSLTLGPGDLKIFTIKILNVDNQPGEFLIKVDQGIYISEDKSTLEPDDPNIDSLTVLPEQRIENIPMNEDRSLGIGFEIPNSVKSGTYVYNLNIYKGSSEQAANQYDRTHKLYIKVV